MNRRALHKLVAEMTREAGGASPFLSAIANAMRALRNQPGSSSPGWLPKHLSQLTPLLEAPDALGTFYQALNAPALEAAYRATTRHGRKFFAAEIPAVTQLFTPRWVVDFLLQNSLGRLWLQWHPDSSLRSRWEWLVPSECLNQKVPALARQLRVCDPACGTMNFGLAAIDMLRLMYRQEMGNAGRPSWPAEPSCRRESEIDRTITSQNLTGYDIDPVALDLARITLELKTGLKIEPEESRLVLRDSLLAKESSERFDVVVTNPPYLSARNLDPAIVKSLKTRYPAGWRDFYTCFILRSLSMLAPGGRLGILCMQSFMFTSAFERLRTEIAGLAALENLAHFGPGLFGVGNPGTLQTLAAVFSRRPCDVKDATFFRLTDAGDKADALRNAIAAKTRNQIPSPLTHTLSHNDLASLPRAAWMYWISPALRRTFTAFPPLSKIAQPRQGLATTDNARFVRFWWEVESPAHAGPRTRWMPYAKGGGFKRWHQAAQYRVNWEDDGREIKQSIVSRYPYLQGQWQWVAKNSALYGKPGITYSYLSAGKFSARLLEKGTIFDVAGSAMFPADPLPLLGVLNSQVAARLLAAIAPTINFQVGDLAQLPVPTNFPPEFTAAVARAVQLTRDLDAFDETSVDFEHPAPWTSDDLTEIKLRQNLRNLEASIDEMSADAYGVESPERAQEPPQIDRQELGRRWVSYALGVCLGRWPADNANPSRMLVLRPMSEELREKLRQVLLDRAGLGDSAVAKVIEAAVGGFDHFFARDFFPWHNRLYRGKPVFWGFGDSSCITAIHAPDASPEAMQEAFRLCGFSPPRGWERHLDDGIAINLSPLAEHLVDRKLATSLKKVRDDLATGRYAFARTACEKTESRPAMLL